MLANFGQAASELGYNVFLFSRTAQLRWQDFEWLSNDPAATFDFELVDFEALDSDAIVVTLWISDLMKNNSLVDPLFVENVRYWNHDELYRIGKEDITEFVVNNCAPIAVANRELIHLNEYLGINSSDIIPLDNWLRRDLFYEDPTLRIDGSIGYLSDGARVNRTIKSGLLQPVVSRLPTLPQRIERHWFVKTYGSQYRQYEVFDRLKTAFPDRELILCEAYKSAEVGKKMRQSDIFVYFNRFRYAGDHQLIYRPDLNQQCDLPLGEGFGLPLFEAMASGAVCAARRHEAIRHLDDVIPTGDSLKELIQKIEQLTSEQKEEIRAQSKGIIEERYRLNKRKRDRINQFLTG